VLPGYDGCAAQANGFSVRGAERRVPNLALFDFDGTITFKDSFTPFIFYAVEPTRMALGKVVLSPMIAAYKLGLVRTSRMRTTVVGFGFRGRREADVREMGLSYAREKLSAITSPRALERIEWHKARGDAVVVVSASLDVYLSAWCKEAGVDLICTELEARGGMLTGRYRHGDCTGKEKARRVRERYDVRAYEVVYAYGDTKEDDAMLALAHKRFFRWHEV
jgi:phosphatidylglycerophosphatase C